MPLLDHSGLKTYEYLTANKNTSKREKGETEEKEAKERMTEVL